MKKTVFERKPELKLDNIIDTDSYKLSHFLLYPDDMEYMESYFEARGGEFADCTIAMLQYFCHRYLSERVSAESIDRAEAFALAHGEPFNRGGWEHILNVYKGVIPVTIRAIPEGGSSFLLATC